MQQLDDVALGLLLFLSFLGGLGLAHVADGWRVRFAWLRYCAWHAYATGDFEPMAKATTCTVKEAREALIRVGRKEQEETESQKPHG